LSLVAALIYWVIVSLWLAVLAAITVAYLRGPRTFGAARLLLMVVGIDTVRNIAENTYFGVYFGAQYGVFPAALAGLLGSPSLLIIPKLINVAAACVVLVLLMRRWLPTALRERADAEDTVREKERALAHEAEERRQLFETSLDLILVTDRGGTFTRVSPSASVTLGYEPDEMVGRSAVDFIYPDDLEATKREMRLARSGQAMRNFETRYLHKAGHLVPLAWSGVWSAPEQKHFFIGRDMTERNAAESRLKQLAHYDQLTGLPNRTSLSADLDAILAQCARDGGAASIAIFDLDGFKDINDTLGHSSGDGLLKQVAQRMMTAANAPAQVYRLGGDEFVLVVPGCGDPLRVAAIVDAMLKSIEEPFEISGQRLFVGASAGVATAPADGATVEDLISNADLALYDAKAAGKGVLRCFVPTLRAKAHARRELDTDLRRAVSDGELVLYFQPQLRLGDGAVVGAEALLRWRHPTRGLLAPGAFIEALRDSAVVLEAGQWILESACEHAAGWRAMGLPLERIGVNLFPAQFHHGDLLRDVEAALLQSGLPPEALELEITEDIALGQDESMLGPLYELRAKGIGLAFDDFGTGYASLSYLTRYPLTRLKIDRSFVSKVAGNASSFDTAIVRSIIAMAHNLGLQVTAEGVETPVQAAFLKGEGCDEVQGYLYAKPLPASGFEAYLRTRAAAADARADSRRA
jgi:diguanylate cyclase (GGDEF)-like protein/PAS domain S-box-containing protein